MQHMIIEGLDSSESLTLRDEAFSQAQKWIHGNYRAYIKTKAMFEKVCTDRVRHLQLSVKAG